MSGDFCIPSFGCVLPKSLEERIFGSFRNTKNLLEKILHNPFILVSEEEIKSIVKEAVLRYFGEKIKPYYGQNSGSKMSRIIDATKYLLDNVGKTNFVLLYLSFLPNIYGYKTPITPEERRNINIHSGILEKLLEHYIPFIPPKCGPTRSSYVDGCYLQYEYIKGLQGHPEFYDINVGDVRSLIYAIFEKISIFSRIENAIKKELGGYYEIWLRYILDNYNQDDSLKIGEILLKVAGQYIKVIYGELENSKKMFGH